MFDLQKNKNFVNIKNSFEKLKSFNDAKLDNLEEELKENVELHFNGITEEYFSSKKVVFLKMIKYFILLIKERIKIYKSKGVDKFIDELDKHIRKQKKI